jgi:hypothetical protein
VHFSPKRRARAAIGDLRTYTVRFSPCRPRGARSGEKCTPPSLPSLPKFVRTTLTETENASLERYCALLAAPEDERTRAFLADIGPDAVVVWPAI